MELTEERKKHIDGLSYEDLLRGWRFAPFSDEMFHGETGQYWKIRMLGIRKNPDWIKLHVAASKKIGW